MSEKHDGKLDSRKPGAGRHVECSLQEDGISFDAEDITGITIFHCYLGAAQALSLLTWLEQERATLQQMVQEQQ